MGHEMKIPIIIPCYKSYHLIPTLLKSLELEKKQEYKIYFVDNVDNEEEFNEDKLNKLLEKEIDKKEFIVEKSFNFEGLNDFETYNFLYSKSINYIFKYYTRILYDKFIILNPDCQPMEENWLSKMLEYWDKIERFDPNITTLGTLQINNNNQVWHFGTFWKKDESKKCHELDWEHNQLYQGQSIINVDGNTGTGIMIDSNKFSELGMYDDKKYPHYSSDADFCLRATKKGYKHYCCNVKFRHQPGSSTKKD